MSFPSRGAFALYMILCKIVVFVNLLKIQSDYFFYIACSDHPSIGKYIYIYSLPSQACPAINPLISQSLLLAFEGS